VSTPDISGPRFFVAGGTLRTDDASYVTRTADRELYEALQSGEFSYVLTSRQMGKSSMMVRTAKALRANGFVVAVVDLTALGQNVSADQWYFTLAERIALQTGTDPHLLEDIWQGELRSPLQSWVRFLEQIVNELDRRIVIFIDEVDVVGSLPFATGEFFAAIRQFHNRRAEELSFDRLTFCLLGVAAPSELIRDLQMTPFNVGRRIELTDFSREEAAVLGAGLGNDPRAQSSLERVLRWTSGHPYLTQRLCQSISGDNRKADVDAVCGNVFLGYRARERDDNLLFVRERMLNARVDRAALLTLYSRILRGNGVRDDDVNPIIMELRLAGICKAVRGKLRVRNPIYSQVFDRRWVVDSMPGAELRRQRAAFRRGVLVATLIAALVISIVLALGFVVVRQRNEMQHQLYMSDMTLAQLAWSHHTPHGAMELLARHLPKVGERDLRGFEWYMLWNLCNGHKPLKVVDAGSEVIAGAAPSDGDKIFAITANRELVEFESTSGARIRSAILDDPGRLIAASIDGSRLATVSRSGWLTLWNAKTLEIVGRKNIRGVPPRVRFSADGQRIVGAVGATLAIWSVPNLVEVASHTYGTDEIRAVEFSPDGRMVAFANRQTFEVWTQDLAHLVVRFPVNQPGLIAFCPDSLCVAVGHYASIDLINLRTKQQTQSLKGDWGFGGGLSFFPDGLRLMNAGSDGTIRIWDVDTGRQVDAFVSEPGGDFASLFAGGRRILSEGVTRYLSVWDANQTILDMHGADEVYSLAFSPDGNLLLSGGNDGNLSEWDPATHRLLRSISVGERIEHLEFIDSNRAMINSTHEVAIWNISTGIKLTRFALSAGRMTAAISQNRFLIAIIDNASQELRLVSIANGQTLQRHSLPIAANTLTFSPNGQLVAVGTEDNELFLWNVNQKTLAILSGCPRSSRAVAFSADGSYLLEGCTGDGDIYVFSTDSKELKITLRGHRESIKSLQYSPDGSRLVSTSDDGSLRVWDARTFQTLIASDESALSLETAAFSPDGRYLAAGGDDHGIRVWQGPAAAK
jgi:WD40 repeat protein